MGHLLAGWPIIFLDYEYACMKNIVGIDKQYLLNKRL
jgi:hypothetical protein